MKRVLLAALVLALSACSPYQLLPAGKVDFVGHGTAQTDIAWNYKTFNDAYLWTQDGMELNAVLVHPDIKDGKTLLEALDVEDKFNFLLVLIGKVPDEMSFRFRNNMTEPEIADLFAVSFSKVFNNQVTTRNVRPATLGGHQGFRFEYSVVGADDVRRQGMAIAAVVDGKLTLLHYFAAEIYYFEKYRPNVEAVFQSYQFKKS